MTRRWKEILIVVFLFCGLYVAAEVRWSNRDRIERDWRMGANVYYGKVVKHTHKFMPDVPNQSLMAEFSWGMQVSGKKLWHHRFRFPETGWALIYGDFGNTPVLGRGAGIFPYISFPVVQRLKYVNNIRIGSGGALLSKAYHVVDNPTNNVIGSRVNNVTQLTWMHTIVLNKRWCIQAALAFTHFSNGNFQKPNLGINVVSGVMGLQYRPNPDPIRHKPDSVGAYIKRFRGLAKGGFAVNEGKTPGAGKFPLYSMLVATVKPVSRYNRLWGGIEYEFRGDMYVTLQSRIERQDDISRWSVSRVAAVIGDELVWGQFALNLQLGYYLNRFEEKPFPFYNKNGIIYYFPFRKEQHWLFISIFLKSHLVVADYIETGIGCLF